MALKFISEIAGMTEHLNIVKDWADSDEPLAVARVIKTWGSAPQPVGSFMFIRKDGKMVGSVSGGCVEGAVVKEAIKVLEGGDAKNLEFGTSNEEAWNVGLACGGTIQVFVQSANFKKDTIWIQLQEHVTENKPCVLISSLSTNQSALIDHNSQVIGDQLSETVLSSARKALDERRNEILEDEENKYFIQIFPRKPTLLIIGAAHVASDLVKLGKEFLFETVVIDPRGYFTDNTTFQEAPDQLFDSYPSEVLGQFPLDAYTFAVILSHDPKIDDNALEILLESEVAYIGAMGSRKITQQRLDRFLEKGYSKEALDRIHGPIGVHIHAKTAKEIALSIMGEIVMVKNQFT